MLIAIMADDASPTTEFERFAAAYRNDEVMVRRAEVTPDVRQDGEPVSRVMLLLSDPVDETWNVDRIRELRMTLGRKAVELGLPAVSLTLVAESDPEAVEAFVR